MDLTSFLSFVASIALDRVRPARFLARTERHQAQVRLVSAGPVRRVRVGPRRKSSGGVSASTSKTADHDLYAVSERLVDDVSGSLES